jgi:hypothetical protein
MSAIKMFPGPSWTDTGELGALLNNDCCDASEGLLPEGQEIKNELQVVTSNKLNRAKRLIITASPFVSYLRRVGITVSSIAEA